MPFLILLLFLAALLTGCGGGDQAATAGQIPINPQPVNEFQLQPNVKVLDGSVTVLEITDTSVTLAGDLSGVSVGDVLIVNQGDQTFARTVVAVNGQVVTTAQPGLTDVFLSANIQETEVINPSVLAGMVPNLPGLTVEAPPTSRVTADQLGQGVQLTYEKTPVLQRGRAVAYLTGKLDLQAAFEKKIQVSNGSGTFSINPVARVKGEIVMEVVASSNLEANLALTNPVTVPLKNIGPLPVLGDLQLGLDLSGQLDGGRSLIKFTSDGNMAQVEALYDMNGNIQDAQADFERTWEVTCPTYRSGARLNFSGSICSLTSRVRFLGPGRLTGNNFKMQLMGFRCRTSPGVNDKGETGTRMEVFDEFIPIMWDTKYQDPQASARRNIDGGERRRILDLFDPDPKPLAGSVTNVRLSPATPLRLRVGESINLSVLADLSDTGGASFNRPIPITWGFITGGKQIVSFDPNPGAYTTMTATQPGKTEITGFYNGVDVIRFIAVEVIDEPVLSLEIDANPQGFFPEFNGNSWRLEWGSVNLTAILNSTTGSPFHVNAEWTSSNNDVASFDRPGHLVLNRPGQTTITATLNGLKAEREVEITAPFAAGLALSPIPPAQLGIGQTLQLEALVTLTDGTRRRLRDSVQWVTNDPAIVAVSNTGLVQGVARGQGFVLALFESAAGVARLNIDQQPVVALQIIPDDPTLGEGQTQALEVFATFADGTFDEISQQGIATFNVPPNAGISIDPKTGVITGLYPGTFDYSATYGGAVALARVTVTGPNQLVITSQPTTAVAPNQTFPIAVELQDGQGTPQPTGEAREVLAFLNGVQVASATIAAGGTTATLNVAIDQPGIYRLDLSGQGVIGAQTADISVVDAASIGKLLVSVGNNIAVADLRPDGALAPVASSPFATENSLAGIARLGNTVFGAENDTTNNNYRLETFQIDPTTGQLTSLGGQDLFPSFVPSEPPIATNGSDTVFVATANAYPTAGGNQLTAVQVDPATGAQLNRADIAINPTAPGAIVFDGDSMTVLSGPSSDLVFLAGSSNGNPIVLPKVEQLQVQVYSFNRAVNPPVLTFLGATNVTAPVDPSFTRTCPAVALLAGRLYVGINFENGPGSITRFDVNTGTGALSNEATAFPNVSPGDFLPLGGRLYASTGSLRTFEVQPNGDLTSVNLATGSSGQMADFVDPANGDPIIALGVTNAVQTYRLDQTTGIPTPLQSTGGFTSARYLAR